MIMSRKSSSVHFVLVHGICHGAWCWYKIAALLKSAGHHVTALDLGACGINPKQLNELNQSISNYVQPLMDFMSSIPEDEKIVLVGHSYGGLPISLAMESFPEKILVAVFVSAYMPDYMSPPAILMQEYFKRVSVESLLDCRLSFDQGLDNPPTSAIYGPDYMKTVLYRHCPFEDLELAKMLVRPGGFFADDFAKAGMLTKQKYGTVNRVFVICEDDEVMKEDFQRWMIEKCPPKEVKLLKGADHMIQLSQPKLLCQCLQEILLGVD